MGDLPCRITPNKPRPSHPPRGLYAPITNPRLAILEPGNVWVPRNLDAHAQCRHKRTLAQQRTTAKLVSPISETSSASSQPMKLSRLSQQDPHPLLWPRRTFHLYIYLEGTTMRN